MSRTLKIAMGSALALAALSPTAFGAAMTYVIDADGAKEVTVGGTPNQGDPNGTAIGTIQLDNGTGSGTTGFAVFNLTLSQIDGTLSAHHIHVGASTTTGSPVIDFGNPNTILTGSPTAGTLSGTITGLPATTITSVFANPTGFYYNLHSTPNFPNGAVRDQLGTVPEPSSLALLALAGGALCARRRR